MLKAARRPLILCVADEPLLLRRRAQVPVFVAARRVDAGKALLATHRPTVFFTQPRLQSPTCSVASVAHLHRLLQLAVQHDFMLVENYIYADMDAGVRPSLASLDQLQRVIYLGSFSKGTSAGLRIGYMLVPAALQTAASQAIRGASWMISPLLVELACRWMANGDADRLLDEQRQRNKS